MRRHLWLLLAACGPGPATDDTPAGDPPEERGPWSTPAFEDPVPEDALRVAIIGDFGVDDANEGAVAEIVAGFEPDAVLTTGDNNYPSGSAGTIDANIGKYYAAYIHPYRGSWGPGGEVNRFWPTPGNHDWQVSLQPYLDYFTLPHNERYYSVAFDGVLEVFALDSDTREPDGVDARSVQAAWLREALAASKATWRLVTLHHPPYSSGSHGDAPWMQWPFGAWGVDFVWAGHDHDYEVMERHGIIYARNGIGGVSLRRLWGPPREGSFAGHDASHGATLATFTPEEARFVTVDVNGVAVDDFRAVRDWPLGTTLGLVHQGAAWRYFDGGVAPAGDWTSPDYDDTTWATGRAQFGFGQGDETTVVSWGDDPADKHVTTWFRHTFRVDRPTTWDALRLGLLANDGAVVYLNGQEIHRIGLPLGPLTPDTLATLDASESFTTIELPSAALVEGDNVIAVEVHLASFSADDMGFDLWLDGLQRDRLLPFGSEWRYDDDATVASGWAEPGFDDRDWKQGPAPLGWGGTAPVATTVDADGLPSDRPAAVWYRHRFEVEDASSVEALLLELVRADGAVVYVNGHQVHRSNVPRRAPLAEGTYVRHPALAEWAALPVRTHLDPSLLVDGTNVIAVEVRVASPQAPVHRFDLSLVAYP